MSLAVNQNLFGKKLNQLDNNTIFFLLVNFNNKNEILSFISQFESVNEKVFFGILNNGGNKSEWVEENSNSNMAIISSEKNLGYIGGAKKILQDIKINSKYIILCNSDIYLNASNFVNYLLKTEYSDEIGIVGPKIKSPNSENQNPLYKKLPSLNTFKKWKLIYSRPLLFNLYYFLSKFKIKSPEENIEFPFALHGSFLIFINSSKFTMDYFETKIFLFGEELHIGFVAKKNNMLLHYDSNISIFHDEHVSTGKLSNSFRRKELLNSIVILEKEIYSHDQQN